MERQLGISSEDEDEDEDEDGDYDEDEDEEEDEDEDDDEGDDETSDAASDEDEDEDKPTQPLLPEIWAQIACYLRRPLPKPHGGNDHASLRQPDLCALMRVNKCFNRLTGPVLYSIVATNSLPLLAKNVGRFPIASNIPTKRQLLSYTSRLFIEYGDKSLPTYPTLLAKGDFSLVYPSEKEMLGICRAETLAITKAARALGGEFRKLKTLSTGVYCCNQREIWGPLWEPEPHNDEIRARMAEAVTAVSELFMLPHVATTCSRTPWGPLTFVTSLWSDDTLIRKYHDGWKGQDHHINRAHFDGQEIDGSIPMVGNGDTRWYFRFDPYPKDSNFSQPLARIDRLVRRILWIRKESSKSQPLDAQRMQDHCPLSIDIHVPWYLMTHGNGVQLQKWLDRAVQLELDHLEIPKHRSAKDRWRALSMENAPRCEACDWSVDLLP